MQLTEQQRKQLWQATAAAYNHHGPRPFRVLRATRRELRTKFGWQEIAISIVVQVIIKLIERWMESKKPAIDPHNMDAQFCCGDVSDEWGEEDPAVGQEGRS